MIDFLSTLLGLQSVVAYFPDGILVNLRTTSESKEIHGHMFKEASLIARRLRKSLDTVTAKVFELKVVLLVLGFCITCLSKQQLELVSKESYDRSETK